MGVFAWTLVSLVVCLESLHGHRSVVLAPQAIVAPGMHEDLVIFKPLRLNLVCPPTRSLVMLTLLHMLNHLKSLKRI